MSNFKNIRIKKRGGGTRTQRVKVLASGKYKFVKNPSKSSSPRKSSKKKSSRKGSSMAKKKRRRRSSGMTIPLAVVGGFMGPLFNKYPHADNPVSYALRGDIANAARGIITNFTGFNPDDSTWSIETVARSYTPLVVGLLIHKFVGGRPLNVNAALARAKIPFVRI